MIALRKGFLITIEVSICLVVFVEATKLVSSPREVTHRGPSNFPMEMPRVSPCPNPEDIVPCQCSFDDDKKMLMDCSNISSEEELKTVFSKEFPFPDFQTLKIEHNKNLEALRTGDLGNASFEHIRLFNCSLGELEDLALMGSYDTLQILELSHNSLQSVPNITPFKKLTRFLVYNNALKMFPILVSSSVDYVHFAHNHIETIPGAVIDGLPSLKDLYLYGNGISHILSGTFANNENLNTLYIDFNKLSTIPQDAIILHGDDSHLRIRDNLIIHLPAASFSGVTGFMYAEANSLTELHEDVWRPLLEDNVTLYIQDNPFECGCDIAWLILNRTLLERVASTPTCYDGEAFVDLDPTVYEELC